MRLLSFSRCSLAPLLALLALAAPLAAQIPSHTDTGVRNYAAHGTTDQPFTIQVVGARRTIENILLLKLALTNNGTAPLQPGPEFAGDTNPTDNNKISAVYTVDPNGRRKYPVIRDAGNVALCSTINPPVKPGERRMLYAQVAALPDTSGAFDLYFPQADPITNIPVGLAEAGQPSLIDPNPTTAGLPTPDHAVPLSPSNGAANPTNNNEPDVYTNQTNPAVAATPLKAIGSVTSANSTVPFSIQVLGLNSPSSGNATLRVAMTNDGSGELIPTDFFTGGVGDLEDSQKINGVFLVDPVSKQRFAVTLNAAGHAVTTRIDPPLAAGERRVLEAQFAPIPSTVKSVYVYFPHAPPSPTCRWSDNDRSAGSVDRSGRAGGIKSKPPCGSSLS